ncbi:helix-loop-helix DNA-binding domain-containing protein [Leptodontidium sp. 2 PMI_412]|nr:helix-loop-helix DNA-binding domain-containing protein [Leptodontidium sp. 2 PMI_412]
MDSQLFDQFLEDRWSAGLCDLNPVNTGSDLCPNYMWLNQYNPLACDFEDLQSLCDLESCNISNSSSPPEFALPSPKSDASPLDVEDRFDQKSFIEPWLNPTAFENSTLTPVAPCNSPSLSTPSLASSPSSSKSNSPWNVNRDVKLKKSKSPVSLRTGKKNKLPETSRGKSSSLVGKGQKNSHNLIEKRYRNNLNSKINTLRECIPSLCSTVKEGEGEDAMDSDSSEMRKAPKCNKGTILDKAIHYIAELEKEVQRLSKENSRLEIIVEGRIPNYFMLGLNKAMAYA